MRLSPVTFVLLLLAGGSSGQQAGTPAPQRPELQIPVSAEVVRIDVIVTGKGGRARQGLTRDDFVVLEDGQPQPVTQFQAFDVPSPASAPAGPKAEAPTGNEAPPASSVSATQRYVVLAVDDIHVEAANLQRLKKTLDRFLEREVPPEDRVALVTTSGARSQDFTSDRHALREVVARLSVQDRRPRQIDVPFIDEYQAERILLGDPEALRVAVEEIQSRRRSPNVVAEAQMVARLVHAEAVANSRNTLETLDNVVRAMASLRGRKVVILVSDGFLPGLQLEGRAGFDIRRITDAGARSGVIVYGLDARGLVASAPGQSASSRGPVMATTVGPREQMNRASELAIHDAMNGLAADTGGFLVAFTNDLSGALQKIMKDTEAYYVLAYEPTNARRDGAFRKIEVRLPGQRDFRIRHRKGYFGPDDRKRAPVAAAPSVGPATTAVPSPEQHVRSAIREALSAAGPRDGLPVRLSADFVSVDAATPQIVVSGHLDLRDVPFVRASDRRLATVDVGGAVFDEAGAEVGTLAVERAALDLTDEAYPRALESGLQYQRSAPVKPGRYRVGIAVREEGSGRIGTAHKWVEVPDLADGRLALSSLFLMREDTASGTPRAPGDGPPLRGVQARPVYKRQESLHVQFFAYNHAGAAGGIVTRTEIWRAGALLAASRPEALKAPPGDQSKDVHTRRIALLPFEPGDYEVRIVVKDEQANSEVSQRAAFAIE